MLRGVISLHNPIPLQVSLPHIRGSYVPKGGGLILLTVDGEKWEGRGEEEKSNIKKHFLSFVGKSQFKKKVYKEAIMEKKGNNKV